MSEAYRMQVVRFKQSDCVTSIIDVGKPVKVVADCLETAKCGAACAKLGERHEQSSSYHYWLVGQTRGKSIDAPYRWDVTRLEIVS